MPYTVTIKSDDMVPSLNGNYVHVWLVLTDKHAVHVELDGAIVENYFEFSPRTFRWQGNS